MPPADQSPRSANCEYNAGAGRTGRKCCAAGGARSCASCDRPALTPIDDIIARLQSLHPKLIDLTLDRMTRVLAQLGHPERKLPPVIHVAGTNGKGSVIAFMRDEVTSPDDNLQAVFKYLVKQ